MQETLEYTKRLYNIHKTLNKKAIGHLFYGKRFSSRVTKIKAETEFECFRPFKRRRIVGILG